MTTQEDERHRAEEQGMMALENHFGIRTGVETAELTSILGDTIHTDEQTHQSFVVSVAWGQPSSLAH